MDKNTPKPAACHKTAMKYKGTFHGQFLHMNYKTGVFRYRQEVNVSCTCTCKEGTGLKAKHLLCIELIWTSPAIT